MLAVKDSNPLDLKFFKENYNITLSKDYNNPEIFFTLFEDDKIVGYSRILIVKDKCYFKDFKIEKGYDYFDKNFFIKATCSKVIDLGFDYIYYNEENFKDLLPSSPQRILDLLKGSCQ